MSHHLDSRLSAEIRNTVGHLPPYPRNPHAIDYTDASTAYAVNITLLHGKMQWHPAGLYLPTADTKALLVERAGGDGKVGSQSGVSGFIDTLHDPERLLTDEAFDPIAYAARTELHEEVGIPWRKISTIGLHLGAILRVDVNLALGQRFEEPRFRSDGVIHVLPILGICNGWRPPRIKLKKDELRSHRWVPLEAIARQPNLSPGYLENTLPNALGALGLQAEPVHALLDSRE